MTFSSLRAAKGEAFAAEGHSKLAETGVAETGPEFEQNNPAPLVELEACYHLEFCYHHQLSLIDLCYFHLLPLQMEVCYCYFHPRHTQSRIEDSSLTLTMEIQSPVCGGS